MKYIRYKMQVSEDAENPVLVDKQLRTHQEDISAILEQVKLEAYNGEYTVEDDGVLAEPTQADRIEAQVAYTAMMTDTLLEV